MSTISFVNASSKEVAIRATLSWTAITDRFAERFNEQFQGKRKAHFDSLPEPYRTVDGAKGKWMLLVLLDAMVYYLDLDHSFPIEARRFFHQQRVLLECILEEIDIINQQMKDIPLPPPPLPPPYGSSPVGLFNDDYAHRSSFYPEGSETMMMNDHDHHNSHQQQQKHQQHQQQQYQQASLPLVEVTVDSSASPWESIDAFIQHHHQNKPTKAKAKFLIILELLLQHRKVQECDYNFKHMIHFIVARVITGQITHGDRDRYSNNNNHHGHSELHATSSVSRNVSSGSLDSHNNNNNNNNNNNHIYYNNHIASSSPSSSRRSSGTATERGSGTASSLSAAAAAAVMMASNSNSLLQTVLTSASNTNNAHFYQAYGMSNNNNHNNNNNHHSNNNGHATAVPGLTLASAVYYPGLVPTSRSNMSTVSPTAAALLAASVAPSITTIASSSASRDSASADYSHPSRSNSNSHSNSHSHSYNSSSYSHGTNSLPSSPGRRCSQRKRSMSLKQSESLQSQQWQQQQQQHYQQQQLSRPATVTAATVAAPPMMMRGNRGIVPADLLIGSAPASQQQQQQQLAPSYNNNQHHLYRFLAPSSPTGSISSPAFSLQHQQQQHLQHQQLQQQQQEQQLMHRDNFFQPRHDDQDADEGAASCSSPIMMDEAFSQEEPIPMINMMMMDEEEDVIKESLNCGLPSLPLADYDVWEAFVTDFGQQQQDSMQVDEEGDEREDEEVDEEVDDNGDNSLGEQQQQRRGDSVEDALPQPVGTVTSSVSHKLGYFNSMNLVQHQQRRQQQPHQHQQQQIDATNSSHQERQSSDSYDTYTAVYEVEEEVEEGEEGDIALPPAVTPQQHRHYKRSKVINSATIDPNALRKSRRIATKKGNGSNNISCYDM